jgi:hypothetical protein
MNDRLTPHPRQTLVDKISLPKHRARSLPRSYFYCAKPSPLQPRDHFAHIQKDGTWRIESLDAGHDAMVTEPDILTGALLALVSD